jgi:hypothetical protein
MVVFKHSKIAATVKSKTFEAHVGQRLVLEKLKAAHVQL